MKDMLKNKKLLAIIGGIIILLAIGITCIVLNVNKKEDAPVHKEETHNMIVKINPLVKLTFKEEYNLCKNDDDVEEICGEQSYKVSGYELINDDAKTFYKDLDFEDKDLYQVLLMLCETAKENKIVFEKLEITTDSKNITNNNVLSFLVDNSEEYKNLSIYVNFKEHINEEELLKDEDIEIKKNTVTFDSNNGSKVESQIIKKGDKATKPNAPTRDGYKFVEWQLDGKAFDFNTEITEDITLKAKWKKADSTNQSNNNNNTENNNQSDANNQNSKPNQDESNNNNTTENDNKDTTSDKINLNDNVMYTETGFDSKDYVSWKIKDVCLNKTIAELKEIDLNYDKRYLDDLSDMYSDSTLITKKTFLSDSALTLLSIFPACKDTIPTSYSSIFDNAMGWAFLNISDNTLKVRFIELDSRYKYSTYHQNLDLSSYNLTTPNPYSGGGTPPTPQILNEAVCKEYHLKCDRW